MAHTEARAQETKGPAAGLRQTREPASKDHIRGLCRDRTRHRRIAHPTRSVTGMPLTATRWVQTLAQGRTA